MTGHDGPEYPACNSVYAAMCGLFPDTDIWSELEVRAGLAPVCELAYSIDGEATVKVPDLVADYATGLEWIEVENTWRSEKDLTKMIACMRSMFRNSKSISCVHFVITSAGAKTIGQRLRKAMTHDLDSGWPRQIKELDARILSQHIKVSALDPETLTLSRVEF